MPSRRNYILLNFIRQMELSVQDVREDTEAMGLVRDLWRAHSSTLGFFPEGAFADAALRKEILGAFDSSGEFHGYLLFRTTREGRVVVVHLCVLPASRGKRVAHQLFSALLDRSRGCHEIRLQCRRDFEASSLWPKLGFVAAGEVAAKKSGKVLTVWRYQLVQLPLLSLLSRAERSVAAQVALDANVFFDLDEPEPNASQGLLADWLTESVELVLTEGIWNEIDRQDNQQLRDHQRARARKFPQLLRDVDRESDVFTRVRKMLPDDGRASTESDARQIAMTIAAGVTFFITQDKAVLARGGELESQFGLEVLQPHEVISRFDELHRAETYRPERFSLGVNSRSRLARSSDLRSIADLLHRGDTLREKRSVTNAVLKEMLAHPSRYDLRVFELESELLAFMAIENVASDELRVPYFSVSSSPIGTTAAHHFVQYVVDRAARQSKYLVRVLASAYCDDALSTGGFIPAEKGHWLKLGFDSVATAPATRERLKQEKTLALEHPDLFHQADSQLELLESMTPGTEVAAAAALAIEKALWPAKITHAEVPCAIVPIQPRWAKELFDHILAEGTLFGSNPQLMFNAENVYYRAPRPRIVSAPSRILWYVSDDRAYQGSMSIRASSYVEEVVVGPAKDLFRRFRRLGIYSWQDVSEIAKGNPDGDIMAFRFARTEVFPRPIDWKTVQDSLRRFIGKPSQFQSPLAISEACFFDLYRRGRTEEPS